jgi:hypothetical protein
MARLRQKWLRQWFSDRKEEKKLNRRMRQFLRQ